MRVACLTFLLYIQISLHGKAAGRFEVLFCRSDPLHQPLNLGTCTFKVIASLNNKHMHNLYRKPQQNEACLMVMKYTNL